MPNPTDFADVQIDRPTLSRAPVAFTGTTIVGSAEVWMNQDYNAKLHGYQGMRAYDEVRRDPVVAAGLANIINPIKSAAWTVAPGKSMKGKDGEMEPSETDKKIAEAAKADFIDRSYGFGRIQPVKGFGDVLAHAFLSLVFGHAALDVYWLVSPEGRHVAEFLPILPTSVVKFNLDPETRALDTLTQRAYNLKGGFDEYTVPASQLEIFTWRQEGDNYWGWAALREVYKPWDLKRVLELVDATGLEKHACGVDELHATEALQGNEEQKGRDLIQNVRSHQRGGLFTPFNMKYELHSTGMNGTGVNPSIARLSEEILLALYSGGLLMGGTQATGNRSLGEVKQEDVQIVLQGIVNWVRMRLSTGTLKKWTIANYGPQKAYPEFECEPLDKMSGTVLAQIIKLGKEAGIFTPGAKSEAWFRGIIRAPEEDEPYQDPFAPPPLPFGADPNDPNPTNPGQPKPKGGEPPDPAKETKPNGQGGKARLNALGAEVEPFWRAPLAHERHVAFTDMKSYLDDEPLRIWYRHVAPIRSAQIRDIAKAVSTMTDAELATGSLTPPRVKELGAALAKSLLEVYRTGRRTVLDEARRSRAGIVAPENTFRFATNDDEEDDDDLYGAYPPEPTKRQTTWIMRIAQALALGMTLKLVEEAIDAGQTAQDQELPPAEIEAAVRTALGPPPTGRLSEKVVQADLGGKVVQTFTTGRVEQVKAMAEEVTAVFYSAMMDSSTCEVCVSWDGTDVTDRYQSVLPNPACLGSRGRCRCEPVAVFRPVTQQEAA